MKFSAYQFVLVTIASVIEAAKYNMKVYNFMDPLFLEN
jgi:hypothetical protein